jgi:hypothetical protein
MTDLLVTLDTGQTVPLVECDWVFYMACGCPFGCTMAVIGGEVLYDEPTTWRSFFHDEYKRTTDAEIARRRKAGVTAKLVHREQLRADVMPYLRTGCPHTS